jgi:hypothetical protein
MVSSLYVSKAHVLDLGVFVDAVLGPLPNEEDARCERNSIASILQKIIIAERLTKFEIYVIEP